MLRQANQYQIPELIAMPFHRNGSSSSRLSKGSASSARPGR